MKKIFFLTICLLIYSSVSSQKVLKIYYDSLSNKTSNKAYHHYREINKLDKAVWVVSEYDKNDSLLMKGYFRSKRMEIKNGIFEYYEDGKLYKTGEYIDDERVGKWNWYFQDGNKSAEIEYYEGYEYIVKYWNQDGSEGDKQSAEREAQLKGGESEFHKYVLDKTILFKALAREHNIRGKLKIGFTINKKGEVIDAYVSNPVDPLIDKEGLEAIQSLPNFIPGKRRNRIVSQDFTAYFKIFPE